MLRHIPEKLESHKHAQGYAHAQEIPEKFLVSLLAELQTQAGSEG